MRLLLVEDEERLRTTLARALREEGYAVDVAPDGPEGLYKAVETEYDAIILDVLLPGQDGWSVLRALRKSRSTPVLMLTACDAPTDRVRGLDGGADDYLGKPFDLHELLARVRSVIRRAAGTPSPSLRIGDIEINTGSRTVLRNGAAVALTAREYGILEFLALHRGKVVSRTDLYEHILDENEDTLSNLIDVHIFNIRRKLGHELIQTRRGQGFCIEPH